MRSTRRTAPNPTPTSDAFINLDPTLHPVTLHSVGSSDRDLSPQGDNRLNDFAQRVMLETHHDGAENLLAFTAGELRGLFGSSQHQPFEEGLHGADKSERAEDELVEDHEDFVPVVDQVEEMDIPAERAREVGKKRRREGEEGENSQSATPAKIKKDSHVGRGIPAR